MSAPPVVTKWPSTHLNRLLDFVEHDAGNLALRKDAINEAFGAGRWQTAQGLIDEGLQMHPMQPDLLALAGFAHLQAQRYADAELALSAAVAQGATVASVRDHLGFALFMQKRYAEALNLISTQDSAEAVPAARVLRARCLHHLNRRDEAIADCRILLADVPDLAETHGLLALLLYERGEGRTARKHAEAALGRDPQQLEALLVLGSLCADARRYDEGSKLFSTLVKAHPTCGRGWLGLALIKLGEGQLDSALPDIQQAATYMPEHLGTWHVLAWIHLQRRDIPAADAALRRALALDQSFAETHGGLAVIAALQGREIEAEASIRRAQRIDPKSLAALYARILLLQKQGRHDEAAAVVDGVLMHPEHRDGREYRQLVIEQLRALRGQLVPSSASIARH